MIKKHSYNIVKFEDEEDGCRIAAIILNNPLYEKFVFIFNRVKFFIDEDSTNAGMIGVTFETDIQYLGDKELNNIQAERFQNIGHDLLSQIVDDFFKAVDTGTTPEQILSEIGYAKP